jgi:DNA-directed RNA polymerase specialized sigma24 family protein
MGRFRAQRDDLAFSALLRRHGPMVLGLCQRMLHNHADAEDAFQATFLVLARNAEAVRNQASVGSWLQEGLARDEAAGRLGWSVALVKSWLETAGRAAAIALSFNLPWARSQPPTRYYYLSRHHDPIRQKLQGGKKD